jgi:hypothetical protein
MKGEKDRNTIIVGDFNPMTALGRSVRQIFNEEILHLSDIFDQMGLSDLYRTFHPTAVPYNFF